ncbi:MAG: hypothetical protein K2N63_11985 [Lachnospiraceae bacterium]|nr:hypothetical protein [Lachnospiraceae bacterium]
MKSRKNYLRFRRNQFKWKLIGWHSDSICSKCGEKAIYQIDKYDAWCCASCNEWLDEVCGDPDCPYCGQRPKTPYEAYFMADMEAGSAGQNKRWRCDNYQHKTNGMIRYKKRREAIDAKGDCYEKFHG